MRRSGLSLVGRLYRSPTRAPRGEKEAQIDAVDDFVVIEVRGAILHLAVTPVDEENAEVAAVRDAVQIEVGRKGIARRKTVVA